MGAFFFEKELILNMLETFRHTTVFSNMPAFFVGIEEAPVKIHGVGINHSFSITYNTFLNFIKPFRICFRAAFFRGHEVSGYERRGVPNNTSLCYKAHLVPSTSYPATKYIN